MHYEYSINPVYDQLLKYAVLLLILLFVLPGGGKYLEKKRVSSHYRKDFILPKHMI